jgi:hypothetical protein
MPKERRIKDLQQLPKLLVRPDAAAWMLDVSRGVLADFGVKPVVDKHRLVLYDVRDLEAARDRLRELNGMAPALTPK